jgi:hypothetical protein
MSSATMAALQQAAREDRHFRRLRRIWTASPRHATAPTFAAWFAKEGEHFRYQSREDIHHYLSTCFGGTMPLRPRRHPPGAALRAAMHQREHPTAPPKPLALFAPVGRAAPTRRWWCSSPPSPPTTAREPPCAPLFYPATAVIAEDDDDDDDGPAIDDEPTAPRLFRDARGTVIQCGDFVRHTDTGRVYVAVVCCPTADGRALRVVQDADGGDGFHDVSAGSDDGPTRLALLPDGVRLANMVVDGGGL